MMIPADQVPGLHSDRVDVSALLRLLWAYKVFIIGLTLLGGGIAAYLALTAVPVFRAEVSVAEVTHGNAGAAASLASQLGGLASLVGVNLGNSGNNGREARSLLNSRQLLEEFINRRQLIPVLYPDRTPPPTLWFAVKHFRDDIVSIREDKRTGLTIVAVNWTDPAIAAKWANDIVALANELLRTRAIAESKASIAYLNGQVSQTDVIDVRKVMYELIENETKSLMLANAKTEYAFTTIDPAVPPEIRFSPRRTLMVLLGLAIGMMLGVIGVFLRNLFRRDADPTTSQARP